MRRSWRGRRGSWNRSRINQNYRDCNSTVNNSTVSARLSSTADSSRPQASQLPIVIPVSNIESHFTNIWKLYLPTEEYPPNNKISNQIKCVQSYVNRNKSSFDLEKIDSTRSIQLDIQLISADSEFKTNWPSFNTDLTENPAFNLRLLEYCLHDALKCESKIKVRVTNHQPIVPLANLKVNYFGKLVTIKGTVIKVGSIGLNCTSMAFECSSCHNLQAVMQPQGIFTAPNHCTHCKKSYKFEPLQLSPFTQTTDCQIAKVQEIQSQSLSGTIPRSVEIELQGDLVGSACPGDVLSVTGIVQSPIEDGYAPYRIVVCGGTFGAPRYVQNSVIHKDLRVESLNEFVQRLATTMFSRADRSAFLHIAPLLTRPPNISSTSKIIFIPVRSESKGGEDGKRAARLLQLYIEAISVHSHRNLSNPTLSFTIKDYYAIQDIHASEDVFRLLVHSLCPSIFGHDAVKAGFILGLMGGTESQTGQRCNPHVLVVGDPGLGKSQLLQAAMHAAPRGVYICGASASAGGLTVALGREAGGDFALEAGALVLADTGVCCVDELDKMSSHHSSLLEAMEQCRVSVAKGGVVCSLAARATVLAAANPAGGIYNKAKTVAENLKINSALLSRFDLVFILLDQPDEKMDAMLSAHVLALHSGRKNRPSASTSHNTSIDNSQNKNSDEPLSKRLRLKPGGVIDPLPVVLLRKYIAYARRYVHPKLSKEASNALQEFYLELRHNHQDGTPITTRQLEACVRLTQARARSELREEATESDANDVISLVKYSLIDTFSDEFGNIQLSRSINGSGVSSRNKLKRFMDALSRRSQQQGKDIFSRQELIQIHKAAGVPGDANDLIDAMHTHSYLLLKGSNTYQFIAM